MTGITYNLQSESGNSHGFYNELSRFSAVIYPEISQKWYSLLKAYKDYIQTQETLRTDQEYIIELLTLMMTLYRYRGASERAPYLLLKTLKGLFLLRKKHTLLKKAVDPLRGFMAGAFLVPSITQQSAGSEIDITALKKLTLWLEATGEFKEECKRFKHWISFLKTLPEEGIRLSLDIADKGYLWFKKEAARVLGRYTENVSSFLSREYRGYRYREDEIFCGKEEVEYHLNMVASQIINEGYKDAFLKTPNRVILVPGCMAWQGGVNCKAVKKGLEIRCSGCTGNCRINEIRLKSEAQGMKLYIVPHSSGFSRWLRRWQNTKEVGVTAVACALNIVAGGFEMRANNIPSQCVLLDYCGCKKHWHNKGIDTEVNLCRLMKVAAEGA